MKSKLLLYLLAVGLFFILSCKQAEKKFIPTNQFESGLINIGFKGEKSGYTWNFKRNVTQQLSLIKKVELKKAYLSSIQLNNEQLTGVSPARAKILFINDSLEVTGSWGTKGEEKNENGNILFHKLAGERLYLYDFIQKAIKSYKVKNGADSLVFYMKINTNLAVYRTCHVSNNTFLYVNPSDTTAGYDFVIIDSNRIISRIPFLKNAGTGGAGKFPQMIYDGSFVFSEDSKYIVYYCNFAGMFIYFDKTDLTNPITAKTIDQTPPPKAFNAELAPNTYRLEINPNILFFPSSAVSQNKLYLLNAINPQHHYVLDIYNLDKGGEYEQSIYIPLFSNDPPISIAIANGKCYVLYNDQSLAVFSIEAAKNSI